MQATQSTLIAKTKPHATLAIICVVYLVLAILSARQLTPTVDEYAHVPAGLTYWKFGDFDLYSKNPPLAKLWLTVPLMAQSSVDVPAVETPPLGWGPWLYGAEFESLNKASFLNDFFLARLMNIVLTLATGLLIYVWSIELGAEKLTASFVTSLFLLSPTILAHGSLATVDTACCGTIALFCYFVGRDWSERKTQAPLVACAFAFAAIAIVTKFTGIFLLPGLLYFALSIPVPWKKRGASLALGILVFLALIDATYGFQGLFAALPAMTSRAGIAFSSLTPSWMRWPLPQTFIKGFDAQLADTETGEFGSYLFGEWSNHGWWYYNFAAYLLKESPVMILALLMAVGLAIKNGLGNAKRAAFLIPFFSIAVPMLFLNRLQIGVRYLIPLSPFLLIFCADQLRGVPKKLVAVGIALNAVIAACAYPNFIAYFNPAAEIAGEPEDLLLDSNFDWGQDLYRLRGINQEAHGPIYLLYFGHVSPSEYGIDFKILPPTPVKGLIAVSANFLKGAEYVTPAPPKLPTKSFVQIDRDQAKWLRNLKPIRREGSIFIYDTRN